MKHRLMLAAALAMAGGWAEAPASPPGYAMPNGWAPSRGNSSRTRPSKAGKKAKNRARDKAAAKSRRQQRAR